MKASNVVDWSDPDHNMYGCAPCPECSGLFRASYRREDRVRIECECGHNEWAVEPEPCCYEEGKPFHSENCPTRASEPSSTPTETK